MAVPEAARGITAVVVTYNPDPARLAQLCEAVQPQVEHVVLVKDAVCVVSKGKPPVQEIQFDEILEDAVKKGDKE